MIFLITIVAVCEDLRSKTNNKQTNKKYMYRAVRCYRAPKGSVVNFKAYQNFIELI